MAGTYHRLTRRPAASHSEEDHEHISNDRSLFVEDGNPEITKSQLILQCAIGIVSGVLLIRFLLALFGANESNGLVGFIYGATDPIVSPFRGIFTLEANSVVAPFEVETLMATIVVILAGLAIIRLAGLFRGNNSGDSRVTDN